MFKDIKYRWALIVSLLIASAYLIWPTYKVYSLSEDEKTELGISVMKELKEGAINLGLDLQGGMYVLLETDIPTLVDKLAGKNSEELKDAISSALKCNKPAVINVIVDPNAIYSFRQDSFKHRQKKN